MKLSKKKLLKKIEKKKLPMKKLKRNLYKLFVGLLLKKGRMPACQSILTSAYLDIFKKTRFSMFKITKQLLELGGLIMEVRKKRMGKQIHTVPFPARSERRKYLTLKNFIKSISKEKKKEKTYKKISNEIIKKILKRSTIAKRNAASVYINVMRNAANAHYRWN